MSSAPPPTAAPGWYPDPQHAGWLRFWSGTAWTDRRNPSAGPAAITGGRSAGAAVVATVLLVLGITMVGLGVLWILVYYLTQNAAPAPGLGSLNIVVGAVLFAIGALLLGASVTARGLARIRRIS